MILTPNPSESSPRSTEREPQEIMHSLKHLFLTYHSDLLEMPSQMLLQNIPRTPDVKGEIVVSSGNSIIWEEQPNIWVIQ